MFSVFVCVCSTPKSKNNVHHTYVQYVLPIENAMNERKKTKIAKPNQLQKISNFIAGHKLRDLLFVCLLL